MTKPPKFRTRFTPPVRVSVKIDPAEKRTKSEFADECDINLIMARYKKTGILPQSALDAAARFGDFSSVPTFHEMQDRVIAAHELFDALPAKVRDAFDNDPGAFIAASETPEGVTLMKQLGLGKEAISASQGISPSQPDPVPVSGGQPAPKEPLKASSQGKVD